MKVLFTYINTESRPSFPIGLTNLASYLEKLGHEIDIFDTSFYQEFALELEKNGIKPKMGIFGAFMQVSLINDGPVTIIMEI